MKEEFTSINSFALFVNVSTRTIQRRISKFNKENSTNHKKGVYDPISDIELQEYLIDEFKNEEPRKENVVEFDLNSKKDFPSCRVHSELKLNQLSTLQRKLSSDWLIVFVLIVILFADMIAFGIIGEHEFQGKIPAAKIVFAVLGLATGIGSVVTYNRIQEFKLSEIWKWAFGVLQFLVFNLTINENWFFAETVMTLMFVLVFIGVQRSIKKKNFN